MRGKSAFPAPPPRSCVAGEGRGTRATGRKRRGAVLVRGRAVIPLVRPRNVPASVGTQPLSSSPARSQITLIKRPRESPPLPLAEAAGRGPRGLGAESGASRPCHVVTRECQRGDRIPSAPIARPFLEVELTPRRLLRDATRREDREDRRRARRERRAEREPRARGLGAARSESLVQNQDKRRPARRRASRRTRPRTRTRARPRSGTWPPCST